MLNEWMNMTSHGGGKMTFLRLLHSLSSWVWLSSVDGWSIDMLSVAAVKGGVGGFPFVWWIYTHTHTLTKNAHCLTQCHRCQAETRGATKSEIGYCPCSLVSIGSLFLDSPFCLRTDRPADRLNQLEMNEPLCIRIIKNPQRLWVDADCRRRRRRQKVKELTEGEIMFYAGWES